MCTQWLWSYPVDVAVAVAQYSDRTYFFQTPASSIPVLKKEWKEKKKRSCGHANDLFSSKDVIWTSVPRENSLSKHRQPKLPSEP